MYTLMMIAGLVLWIGAHYFKRIAPDARAKLGEPGKGLVAILILAGLALIIVGYRNTELGLVQVWFPPSWMIHINNLLMLLAFWVFGSSAAQGAKAWPANRIRHPQLTAVKIFTLAHLLVNGDLINKAEPEWPRPETASERTYIRLGTISVVLFSVVAGVHNWLGYWPFPA